MSITDYLVRTEHYGTLLFNTRTHEVTKESEEEIKKLEGDGFTIRRFQNQLVPGALTAPLKLFINVSNHCNLECLHCFSNSSPQKKLYLPIEKLLAVIDEAADMGVFLIIIGGGEPFMRRDIWDVIAKIRSHGMGVSLTTNGFFVNKEIIDNIKKFDVRMNISLDGARETHDRIRRKTGAYDKTITTIRTLKNAGINLTIRFSLMSTNLLDTPQMLELAKTEGVKIKIRRVKPSERAIDNDLIIKEPTETYYKMVQLMNDDPNCGIEDIMSLSPSTKNDIKLSNSDCGAGTRLAFLDADGTISPCSFLGKEFVAGNINQNTLKEMWRSNKKFDAARRLPTNSSCTGCSREDNCHNECPAIRLHARGSLTALDPACMKPYITNQAFYKIGSR